MQILIYILDYLDDFPVKSGLGPKTEILGNTRLIKFNKRLYDINLCSQLARILGIFYPDVLLCFKNIS